ncbi:unnamed protein product [Ixodes persulcatus]
MRQGGSSMVLPPARVMSAGCQDIAAFAANSPVEFASHRAPVHGQEAIHAEPTSSAGIASPQCTGARYEAHSTGLIRRDQHFENRSPRREYRIAYYSKFRIFAQH